MELEGLIDAENWVILITGEGYHKFGEIGRYLPHGYWHTKDGVEIKSSDGNSVSFEGSFMDLKQKDILPFNPYYRLNDELAKLFDKYRLGPESFKRDYFKLHKKKNLKDIDLERKFIREYKALFGENFN